MAHTAAPAGPVPSGSAGGIPLIAAVEGLAKALFAAFVFFACFAFSETSPYDAVAIPTILLWLCLGVRLHRGAVPLVALLLLYLAGIVTALLPYLNEEFPVTWTVQLVYLSITCIFFAMFFADDTHARMELALKAPFEGTVSGLAVSTGAQVALGATLVEVNADE